VADEGGAIRELLAVFGFKVDTAELQKGESQLNGFLDKVEKIAKGFAAVFVTHEIFEFANQQAELLDRLDDTANALGITTERVQELQFASRSLGDDADRLLNSIGRLQVAQQAAAKGGQEQAQAFSAIGVSVHDTSGKMKAADELFLDVADGIAKLTDPSKQAATSVALFGREGRVLLPFLKEGRKGFQELADTYKELGGGYTKEAIERGGEFQKSQAKLNLTLTALKNQVLIRLLPILSKIVDLFTGAARWVRQMTKDSYLLQAALGVLAAAGTAFAIQMAIANAPLLLITAAIAALILIVDDLVTLLEGGESVIGDVIDRIYGKDAHVEKVQQIKDAWNGVKGAFDAMWPVVKSLWEAFKWFGENLGKIGGAFGDALAKANNYAVEHGVHPFRNAPASTKSQLTDVQRATAEQGRRLVEARITGEPFRPTTVPKEYKGREADFQKDIERWASEIESGKFPQFAPRVEGPINAPAGAKDWAAAIQSGQFTQYTPRAEAPAPGPVSITQTINPAPGMDEKQLGEHAAKAVHEVIKQRNRAAAATLQRAQTE
jgi:hypothetical protein